ncbi:MAG: DUF1249 domain-containing protein [Proteobacteria bacterium]|nr:DUF1249 domain-containing protein [Pseudomonadota bacterium]
MNFNTYMDCCSANYQRLLKILPKQYTQGAYICRELANAGNLLIEHVQAHAHTETFNVKFESMHLSAWLPNLDIQINIYHDASLSEVTAIRDNEGKLQFFGNPATAKILPYWEKWQMNQLFGDILALTLKQPKWQDSL